MNYSEYCILTRRYFSKKKCAEHKTPRIPIYIKEYALTIRLYHYSTYIEEKTKLIFCLLQFLNVNCMLHLKSFDL